ncbi:MAG: hypothetical protein ACREVL_20290 [Solimonas sp.]
MPRDNLKRAWASVHLALSHAAHMRPRATHAGGSFRMRLDGIVSTMDDHAQHSLSPIDDDHTLPRKTHVRRDGGPEFSGSRGPANRRMIHSAFIARRPRLHPSRMTGGGEQTMVKINKLLATVAQSAGRPAEAWRFLRQAVHELHVVLQGATQLVGDFETRLASLEASATSAAGASVDAGQSRGKARKRKTKKAAG